MPRVLIEGVASTIRDLRTAKNLSQEELAIRAELDRTYISGVERGVRNITLESLEKITDALEIDVSEFLNEVNLRLNGQ